MKIKPNSLFKVGGSLLGWPNLFPALQGQIKKVKGPACLLFGGGVMVDLLRDWNRDYHFGENASHWLAIEALDLIARAMVAANPDWNFWGEAQAPDGDGIFIIAPSAFCRWDASRNPQECLPESWTATSDSIALRIATVWEIENLTLIKSINPDQVTGDLAHKAWEGLVDPVFGGLAGLPGAPSNIRIVGLKVG